jgi:hypothetical protein
MPEALWVAFGMTIGTAVLYAALGIPRPLDRVHLSFACIMVMVAAYAFFEAELDRSTTSEMAVAIVRKQVVAAHGLIAALLVFVPAYTRVRIPRRVLAAYAMGLFAMFVANLVAPYGVWFSAEPRLVFAAFGGVPYTVVVAPPPSALQWVHAIYVVSVFALTFSCALKQVRHGERRRGLILAVSLVIVIVQHVVDVIREAVGGTWAYSDEFGFVAWSLIMSVQLAIDYRMGAQRLRATLTAAEQHTTELARTAEAALHVRDKLITPLQTLELTLAVREPRALEDQDTLLELRGAVTEISELSLAVERTVEQQRALAAALERAS